MEGLDSFGAWLRQRRTALGLTRAELAECAGCSVSALRKIEADERRPSRQLAELLAGCLRILPEEQPLFLDAARGVRQVARLGAAAPGAPLLPSGPSPVSPAVSASARSPAPTWNLPAPATPLIGREAELATLARLLDDPACRLLTLAGPGGIGKTRLAIEVACLRWDTFVDGVCFASLASVSFPEFMVPAIAQAVDFNFSGPAVPRSQLVNYLGNKQMLLLLDNLEHLLDGVDLVVEILEKAPRLKLLATSRERLGLQGEWVFEVQGLPVPAGEQVEGLESYSAVQLFLQRAHRASVAFKLPKEDASHMVRICRLVEGMPLAIELAAAWVPVLSCREIADEIERGMDLLATSLRDVPARQRSLRAAFEHSWNLLSLEERSGLSRLAVFQGGFSRQAAEQVAGVTLRLLSALAAKSLLRWTARRRYDLHPVVHQYAAEKLQGTDEYRQLHAVHSRHYLDMLNALEVDIKGRRQLEALDEIEAEIENIRVAWEWAVVHGDGAGIAGALESLYLFFEMRSRYQEGADFLRATEEQIVGDDNRVTGRIAVRRSILRSNYQNPHHDIESHIGRALQIARRDDPPEMARALFALGYYHAQMRNDYILALPFLEESLEAFRLQEDRFYITRAMQRIGLCKIATSGQDAFFDYTRQSLALAEETGNKLDAARSLGNLSSGAIAYGDYNTAEEGLSRAMEFATELGDRGRVAFSVANLSLLRFLQGELQESEALARRGLALAREVNISVSIAYSLAMLGVLTAVTGDYPLAMKFGRESQQIPSSVSARWLGGWAVAMASCGLHEFESAWQEICSLFETTLRSRWPAMTAWLLPTATIILADRSQASRAVELLALASTHPLSSTGWMEHWSLLQATDVSLENGLGSEAYQAAWNRGRALELEEVVRMLLAD